MVAIPIKFFVVIVLAVACCHCQSEKIGSDSSTWEKLQISPDAFSSVEYANFLIEIYEHTDNNKAAKTMSQKKYFYSPLAILDHKSAVSSYNRFTKKPEMRFRIEMWNDKVQNEVIQHLKKIVGQEIQSDNVKVFPMKKIILISEVPTEDYSISPVWANFDSKSKSVWFSLSCYDPKICDELADEMRSAPKHLDHFKLLFRLTSQTSQTKQATISIDSVTSGSMVSHLLQKFEDKNEIFLTANDEKKMLTEAATNIRMETFDESEIASPDTENQIVNILKDLLITSRMTIKEQNDKMWDSVFWNDDNYRPDKTTKTLNEILNKLDTETQKKLANLFQKAPERQSGIKFTLDEGKNEKRIQHNYDANSWTEVDKISSIISGKLADTSVRVESFKGDVEKLLRESRNHVQFEGEKFVPKPIQFGRINLDKFRDSQSFQDRNVRVRYTNAELSATIKLMEHAELTVTDEWNNLKDQLKGARADLVHTHTEVESVKNELKGNAQLLANVMTTVDNLKKEVIGNKAELHEMKASAASTSIGRMPKSCGDLQKIGHRKSGFFTVMGNKTVDNVYCDFTKPTNDTGFQKVIGYFDVKTSPVYFHAQKSKFHTTVNTVIPFEILRLNIGNAMSTSGIFVAPKSGKYFFTFSGISDHNAEARVEFQVMTETSNWTKVGIALGHPGHQTFSLKATLELAKGNQIRLLLIGGVIHDGAEPRYTNYVGYLLEEDIIE